MPLRHQRNARLSALHQAARRLAQMAGGSLFALSLVGVGVSAAGSEAPVTPGSITHPAPALVAAYLYHFTKFIQWPAGSRPQRLCYVGQSQPLWEELQKIRDKTGGDWEVQQLLTVDTEYPACELLYTEPGHSEQLALWHSRAIPALIVVESEADFAYASIRLLYVNNKLTFDIHRPNARQSGLVISGKLLQLAHRIQDANP